MTAPQLKMLFVRKPNHYCLDVPTSGETIALSALDVRRLDSADMSTLFVPDVDWNAARRDEKICSSVCVNRPNCLLYNPTLCNWNDRLWLHCLREMIEKVCDSIFAQNLLPFFAVEGGEANGKIVQLLHRWGWKRLV